MVSRGKSANFSELAGANRRAWILPVAVIALIIFLFLVFTTTRGSGDKSFAQASAELVSSGNSRAVDFVREVEGYRDWISRRGSHRELGLFESFSRSLSLGFLQDLEAGETYISGAKRMMRGISLRLTFLIVSAWRLWLLVLILGILWGVRNLKSKGAGEDLLSQTGTGRLFYSGIHVGLDDVTSEGAPQLHVTGLACPPASTLSAANSSEIASILDNYSANNGTNTRLCAIILAHPEWPTYVAPSEENSAMEAYYSDSDLPTGTANILEQVLELHQRYQRSDSFEQGPDLLDEHGGDSDRNLALVDEDGPEKIGSKDYAKVLQYSLERVLTPRLREEMAGLPADLIATVVLAYQAGKSMAYAFEAGRWGRSSNFPELAARAVMHSVPEYGKDYSYEARMLIRRSLIFGSRKSIFGPVALPLDFTYANYALRQWVELLMACPHQLQAVADDVELYALLTESHNAWYDLVIGGALSLTPTAANQVYATPGKLFFLPISKVADVMRQAIPADRLDRMRQLISLVSQKQTVAVLSDELQSVQESDAEPSQLVLSYERIQAPLTAEEVVNIAARYQVDPKFIDEWSVYRVVLDVFAWLAKRVGDYSVRESAVVFAAFDLPVEDDGPTETERISARGMVALRGTNLHDQWGNQWAARFSVAEAVTITESEEEFETLQRGGTLVGDSVEEGEEAP